jgi:hypothetical protein
MDIAATISQLSAERDKLQQAIDALERLTTDKAPGKRRGPKPRRIMSAEARRRIGLAMKKRWAERKKAAHLKRKPLHQRQRFRE